MTEDALGRLEAEVQKLRELIAELVAVVEPLERWLVDNATKLPALVDIVDADMAIMYLRHLRLRLGTYV